MESEHRRCDIIPHLKRTHMSLFTELGFTGAPIYTDAVPTALQSTVGILPADLTKVWCCYNSRINSHQSDLLGDHEMFKK